MKHLLFFLLCISNWAWSQSWTGTASYYADKFEGRKTSSGEVFKQNKLTAAHKSLPFGTMVRVTNLSNDSVVVVKINDRLPASSSRMIDLSKKAAEQLNFIRKGLTKVRIETLSTDSILADYNLWRKEKIMLSSTMDSALLFSERKKLAALDTTKIEKNIHSFYRDLAWNYYSGYVFYQFSDTLKAQADLQQSVVYYRKLAAHAPLSHSDTHNFLWVLILANECEEATALLASFLPQATAEEQERLKSFKAKHCD